LVGCCHELELLLLAVFLKLLEHLRLRCHRFRENSLKIRHSSIDVRSIGTSGTAGLGGLVIDSNLEFILGQGGSLVLCQSKTHSL
jgi:hypothetical protein